MGRVSEVKASLPIFLRDIGKSSVQLHGSEGIEGKKASKLKGKRWKAGGGTKSRSRCHALLATGAKGK